MDRHTADHANTHSTNSFQRTPPLSCGDAKVNGIGMKSGMLCRSDELTPLANFAPQQHIALGLQ